MLIGAYTLRWHVGFRRQAFYGYLNELGGHRVACSGHLALAALLKDANVDGIVSPYKYSMDYRKYETNPRFLQRPAETGRSYPPPPPHTHTHTHTHPWPTERQDMFTAYALSPTLLFKQSCFAKAGWPACQHGAN